MSSRTLRFLTVGVTVIVVGLVAAVVAQLADYARRVALLDRLTHNVGGSNMLPSSLPSPIQLVFPGLEVVVAVALVAVLMATVVRVRLSAHTSRP